MSHCLHDHMGEYMMRDGEEKQDGLVMKSTEWIEATVEKARVSPGCPQCITREMLMNYARWQTLEAKADSDGLLLLVRLAAECEPGHSLLMVMGGVTYFWFSEFIERVFRTLSGGPEWIREEKYHLEPDVTNLLYRGSHSAPLSRLLIFRKARRQDDARVQA